MCKPAVQYLKTHADGPCQFTVRSHTDACAAYTLGETWREKLANVLRRWADKAEGVRSFTFVAYGPDSIEHSDTVDAMIVATNSGTKYLNDLWRDRSVGSAPVARAIQRRAPIG